MSDLLSHAFNGRTVAKLSVQLQNPDGTGPLCVSVEFEGGGSLAVVTLEAIRAVVPSPAGSQAVMFTPVLVVPRSEAAKPDRRTRQRRR